jgi:DNA repair exonuclease SbcCD ATPase subunit
MGAKRKATAARLSNGSDKSPAGKKARVSETPESIALSKLIAAFEGEVATMLPPSVVEMVKSVADKCLMNTVENRDELESTFAKVVGEAVQTALEGLQKAHKEAIEGVTAEEEKVQALQEALDSANTLKEQADKALEDANGAQIQASEKKSDAETELENHVEEENGLQPKKELMESDLNALKEVSGTVRGPAGANKKDVQKLQKALKEVEAPQSLIAGIGEAIGKTSAFDLHFVEEASKLLHGKSSQIEGELAKFSETVAEYAEKTGLLSTKVEQLTTDLTERDTELVAAKKKQKDCIAAIKEAEKQKKAGDKCLEKATNVKDEKESAEGVGTDAETQYKFLLERTGVVPMIEAPEVAAEVEAC